MWSALNRNAGAVQALTTAVLVAVTVVYTWLTRQIVSATRTSQRPYVYLDITSEGGAQLQLGVANYGERAAENVSFVFKRDIEGRDGRMSDVGPFANGIAYLPPGRRYAWSFWIDPQLFNAGLGANVIEGTVTYSYARRPYTEPINVDLASMKGVMLSSFRDTGTLAATHLGEIARHLSSRDIQERVERMGGRRTRLCPSCREAIAIDATKCYHCMELVAAPPGEESGGLSVEDLS